MATKITNCPKCDSYNITEINPDVRETSNNRICKVQCKCNKYNYTFPISTWTYSGKRRGIRY